MCLKYHSGNVLGMKCRGQKVRKSQIGSYCQSQKTGWWPGPRWHVVEEGTRDVDGDKISDGFELTDGKMEEGRQRGAKRQKRLGSICHE